MVIADCVLSFSIGNGPRRLANYHSCFSNSRWSILELLGSIRKSIMVHHSSVQQHHSSMLHHPSQWAILQCFAILVFHQSSVLSHSTVLHQSSVSQHSTVLHQSSVLHHSTVLHQSSVLHHSTVLHRSSVLLHLLATVLWHVIMLLYNSTSSTILLPMGIRLVDYLTASLKS